MCIGVFVILVKVVRSFYHHGRICVHGNKPKRQSITTVLLKDSKDKAEREKKKTFRNTHPAPTCPFLLKTHCVALD